MLQVLNQVNKDADLLALCSNLTIQSWTLTPYLNVQSNLKTKKCALNGTQWGGKMLQLVVVNTHRLGAMWTSTGVKLDAIRVSIVGPSSEAVILSSQTLQVVLRRKIGY